MAFFHLVSIYVPFCWANLSKKKNNFCKLILFSHCTIAIAPHSLQLLAGGMAGSLSWWIICPLELLKNQLQAQKVVHPDPPPPKCHQSAQNAVPSMSSCSIRSICVEIFRKAQQQHWRGQEGTWAQPASPPLLHSNCDTARRLRNWLLGLSAFYRGGLLIACRAFPVNACVFYVHAKCRELFWPTTQRLLWK